MKLFAITCRRDTCMFYMCLDYVPMYTSVIKCLYVSNVTYIDRAG